MSKIVELLLQSEGWHTYVLCKLSPLPGQSPSTPFWKGYDSTL